MSVAELKDALREALERRGVPISFAQTYVRSVPCNGGQEEAPPELPERTC